MKKIFAIIVLWVVLVSVEPVFLSSGSGLFINANLINSNNNMSAMQSLLAENEPEGKSCENGEANKPVNEKEINNCEENKSASETGSITNNESKQSDQSKSKESEENKEQTIADGENDAVGASSVLMFFARINQLNEAIEKFDYNMGLSAYLCSDSDAKTIYKTNKSDEAYNTACNKIDKVLVILNKYIEINGEGIVSYQNTIRQNDNEINKIVELEECLRGLLR